MKIKLKKSTALWSIVIIAILIVAFVYMRPQMSMEEMREDFISQKLEIIGMQAAHGNYDCCLEKPCTYCIEKTPGHGEGAECHCREDVLAGRHPCGECIGEIMEGHGKPELAQYYAKAIAEKIDPKYEDELQQMITTLYSDKDVEPSDLQKHVEENKEELSEIACHCGCEHTSLYNCYEEGMLTNCGVCMNEYEEYKMLKDEGKDIKTISDIIDDKYGSK